MRAASTSRLIWPARRFPSLLLSATLFAWLPRAALAQETELKLRLSEQLSRDAEQRPRRAARAPRVRDRSGTLRLRDRKSTRLNSSHEWISYAVFCLKKKKCDVAGRW